MFRPTSNATCNNALFILGTIPEMTEEMHESAARLYEAAKKVGTEGKSALARLLNESPQVVNNWELRGVSERGALKAQAVIGCNALYILTGEGVPTIAGLRPEVQEIATALGTLDPEQFDFAMQGIRYALEAAPLKKSAGRHEDDGNDESSSSFRRAL